MVGLELEGFAIGLIGVQIPYPHQFQGRLSKNSTSKLFFGTIFFRWSLMLAVQPEPPLPIAGD